MIDRMLTVRNSMAQVLEELQWDNLLSSEWRCLQAIQDLLRPFAVFTALVQGEDFTTASCVIPAIMDLSIHLHELQQNPDVGEATQVLLHELKKGFKKITDPDRCLLTYLRSSMPEKRLI